MGPTRDAMTQVSIKVNGKVRKALIEPRTLLVHFLREQLNLTGTHVGCDTSQCGACTVLIDGRSAKSCTIFAVQAEGSEIVTIEGLAKEGQLHPLQNGFWEEHGLQCGYCTPGMIMSGVNLLSENPKPSEREIREAMQPYVARARSAQPALDIGCGRGEFLLLCKEEGIDARGFDLNERSVADLKQRGLNVSVAGIPECFDGIADGSIGSILAAHVVFRIRDVFLRIEYLTRKTEMSLGEDPMSRFRYGPGSDGEWDPNFVKDGAYAELEVPLGSRLTAVLREDGLRRRGNVVMTSEMRSDSALLRHTAALAIVLRSQLRLKLSYEYYDFTDFEDNSVVHVGIAGPF